MMQLYPAHAAEALEFDKIRALLLQYCRSAEAKRRVEGMKYQDRLPVIRLSLAQTEEYRQILAGKDYFPNDFTADISEELQLLAIPGAVLNGDQIVLLKKLALTVRDLYAWFGRHKALYPHLQAVAEKLEYHKEIDDIISAVADDIGYIRDTASRELARIRSEITAARQELRRVFESVLRKLNKQGYLAEISEGFLNGRRTVAVAAEHKRIVKGILHGESDSQRIVFIEPEETIALNNDLAAYERAEAKEIQRILAETTAALSGFQPSLEQYYRVCGIYDFIRAKARLALSMNASMPQLSPHPVTVLIQACHPLLLLQNASGGKPVVPLDITLQGKKRILVISGPNAGGKTVAMKTVGLLQLMVQAGLLIPADPRSELGIYRQLMIHIGDTQSIAQELSTYSAHLKDMKYFIDFSDAKTLFFIDELGSGSDPGLGGAFAEAILEELSLRHAKGIVTTHYLNLKVMAGKVPGIFNGAMEFDEQQLVPLYRLQTGKPGSSYTFAVARRSGLPEKVIDRARELTDKGHFELDRMLHQVEQRTLELSRKEKQLDRLILENERSKASYEALSDQERIRQQQEIIQLQNQVKKDELAYLQDMERKFRQIVRDWKTSENKSEVIQAAEKVLFRQDRPRKGKTASRKTDKHYLPSGKPPEAGGWVRNMHSHQIGIVMDIRDKELIIKIGNLPFTVRKEEWIPVIKKETGSKREGDTE